MVIYKKVQEHGLNIGEMTNQVLAIFYLNDLDHFIKEKLKVKGYIRYQDDFLVYCENKVTLKEYKKKIEKFLNKEKLKFNPKTRIYNSNNNFIFVGVNKYGKYSHYRNVKRRIKKKIYECKMGKIDTYQFFCSVQCFENLMKRKLIFKEY